ncbi:MAG: ABC transporter substrate-binding protein [Phycisphaerales bacterium]|jgi:ABC-type transport system substrate-binding protein|nr:ABC transporter substrate-binding protein [Phycisphaerales bacterium]
MNVRIPSATRRVLTCIVVAAMACSAWLPSARAQDERKIVRIPMVTAGPGTLDPIMGSTQYDNRACSAVYDTLYQYKYLARPLQLTPSLAAEMPEVGEGGKVWRIKLKPGVFFIDDPCFSGGKGRELVAEDVVYSWKRIADPQYRFKSYWLIDGIIEGFDAFRDDQVKRVDAGQKFDYSAEVSGLRAVGKHELEIRLNEPNQQFLWKLAMFQLSVVPREAVETYGDAFNRRPIGTGPFVLRRPEDWQTGTRMTLHRNPNYREEYYPDEFEPGDEKLGLTEAAGKRVPLVDTIEFDFYVEAQPMWLEFQAGNLEFTTVPQHAFEEAFSRRTKELRRTYTAKGIREVKVPLLDFIFRAFNMEDPLLGGYTPEKKALRQAFNLAMDWHEMNEALYFGLCVEYDGPIPPGLDGHPKGEDRRVEHSTRGPNFDLARQKLREAGYTIGADGKVQNFPPIEFYTSTGGESQRIVELLQRNLEEVGIRLNPRYLDFAPLMQAVDNRKAPMFSFAWGSDYPDGENNLALFYGPNESPGANHSNYKSPEYDRLYEQIRTMPPGPERTAIYEQMRDLLIEDAPFCGSLARTRVYLIQPWLKNFKPTEDFYTYIKYVDVDLSDARRAK